MKQADFGQWRVIFDPDDGARINSLIYKETDLFTTAPADFKAPEQDYGEYEMRPVYGYDDCFPSVNECPYPETNWQVPDHGEVCWLVWEVAQHKDRLIFTTQSEILPLSLIREMRFSQNELVWRFTVTNSGKKTLPFQHVMHPLMPLSEIRDMALPEFGLALDEIAGKDTGLKTAGAIKKFLLSRPSGTTNMLFLQDVKSGIMSWTYASGVRIEAEFPSKQFPAIGIWWNNNAYPDEDGCRRNECAFEPIPGMTSTLTHAIETGHHLLVEAGQSTEWQIKWRIK